MLLLQFISICKFIIISTILNYFSDLSISFSINEILDTSLNTLTGEINVQDVDNVVEINNLDGEV